MEDDRHRQNRANEISDLLRDALKDDFPELDFEEQDLFFAKIKGLAGKGLDEGKLEEHDLRSLCASVLEHEKDYREKNGIFRYLRLL